MKLKVSIITPSFNQGQFIERTLASVALQAGVDMEHVVVDGGSVDNTVDILKRFSPGIRWVSEKDHGQADAVNKGIRATDGEIIGWLNSDDIYYPDALAQVVNCFLANPDVDVVYGKADHINLEDVPFEDYPTEPWDFERLKTHCFLCQPAVFFRRHLIHQYGFLDESLNYCMDYNYWLRLAMAGVRFRYLEIKLAGSRMYSENKTNSARLNVHGEINDMLKGLLGRVPDKWLFNYAHTVVEQKVNKQLQNKLFCIEVFIQALLASIRWNSGLSISMVRTFVNKSWAVFKI